MADDLTDRQRQVLELFVDAARAAMPWPTYRHLCEELGFRSTHAAHGHCHALIKKGWLEKASGFRTFMFTDHTRRIYGLPRRAA